MKKLFNKILSILHISNNLFKGSKPLEGKPLELLNECFEKSGKKKPTLKGRL